MVCRVSDSSQGLGDSALKLVGEPFVAFEQIKVRLPRVVYGLWQDLDLDSGPRRSGLAEHLGERFFARTGLGPTRLPLGSATKGLL
jgi:hypothetical protein